MIVVNEKKFGNLVGEEISFFTGEDINEPIYLGGSKDFQPDSQKLFSAIGQSFGPNSVFGICDGIRGINLALESIYSSFKKLKEDMSKMFPNSEKNAYSIVMETLIKDYCFSLYRIGIQNFTNLLYKLCYAIILFKSESVIPSDKSHPQSILSLFDSSWESQYKEDIINIVFKRPETKQLFIISEQVNNTFQSQRMFSALGFLGESAPTICAFANPLKKEIAFTFHNHLLYQLVKELDTALHDTEIIAR